MDRLDDAAIGRDALGLEIGDLASDHAAGAGRGRESRDQAERPSRVDTGTLRALRGDPKRLRQQRIARENRERLTVDDVHGRPAAAELVVVHRGEVVVHERVRVHELDGAPEG